MFVRIRFKKPIYPSACGRVGQKVRGGPAPRLLMACLIVNLVISLASAAEPVSFRSQIATVLLENCLACHGPKKAEGGYRVDTFEELQRTGDSGESPIVASDVAASELIRRLTTDDESLRMPADSEPLPTDQVELMKSWVAEGAKFDGNRPSESLLTVMPPATYSGAPDGYPRAIPVTALAFTPDNTQIVSSGYHELLVWNAEDGKLARRISNVAQTVYEVVFLPDQKTLAVACGDPGIRGEVRLMDFASGEVQHVIARSIDVVLDVAVRPQGNQLAAGGADGMVHIINLADMTETRTLASHADWVTSIAWSGDGTRLASASRDKSVKVFDSESGELLVSYTGHNAAVRSVIFASDGKTLLSAGADNQLHRWSLADAAKVAGIGVGGEAFRLRRSDEAVWLTSTDRNVRKFELSNNTISQTVGGHQDWVLSLAIAPDGKRLASGSLDGEIRTIDATSGAVMNHWIARP